MLFWFWTHLSFVVASACLLLAAVNRAVSGKVFVAMIIGLTAFAFLPVMETDLSGYALAHMGTLSVPTVVLLIFEILIWRGMVAAIPSGIRRNQNLCWVAAGLLLYPSATGFLSFDAYAVGYSRSMAWLVVMLSSVAVVVGYQLLAMCLTTAVLGYCLGVQESPNLWDYLIDPWLCIAAGMYLSRDLLRVLRFGDPSVKTES